MIPISMPHQVHKSQFSGNTHMFTFVDRVSCEITSRWEAIAIRLEAILLRCRPSPLGPLLVGWMPSLGSCPPWTSYSHPNRGGQGFTGPPTDGRNHCTVLNTPIRM